MAVRLVGRVQCGDDHGMGGGGVGCGAPRCAWDPLVGRPTISILCADTPRRLGSACRCPASWSFFFCLLHGCLIEIVPTLCCGARIVVCSPSLPRTLPLCPSPLRCRASPDAGKGHKLPSGPTGSLVGRRRCGRAADGARRLSPPTRGLPAAAGRLPAAGLPAAAPAGRIRRAPAGLPHHRGGGAAARWLPAAAATAGLRRCPGACVCEPAGAGAAAKGQLDAAGVLFGAGRLVRWGDQLLFHCVDGRILALTVLSWRMGGVLRDGSVFRIWWRHVRLKLLANRLLLFILLVRSPVAVDAFPPFLSIRSCCLDALF